MEFGGKRVPASSPRPSDDQRALVAFYEAAYTRDGARDPMFARWRALGAVGKADHVVELCARAGIRPQTVLEVGCGEGALLSELRSRGFGARLRGLEITQAAVDAAAARPEIDSVELYDGQHVPGGENEHDLGVVSHVLEHVPAPAALLGEVARACRAVVVEVPLEDNMSGRRSSRSAHSDEIGHVQRLNRTSTRAIISRAGLRIVEEMEDPLPRSIHTFFAASERAARVATAKWLVRSATHRCAPALARRLFTLHYACLCVGRDDPSQRNPHP